MVFSIRSYCPIILPLASFDFYKIIVNNFLFPKFLPLTSHILLLIGEVIVPLIQKKLSDNEIDENIKTILLGNGKGIW